MTYIEAAPKWLAPRQPIKSHERGIKASKNPASALHLISCVRRLVIDEVN
jgi:hypothetical protein